MNLERIFHDKRFTDFKLIIKDHHKSLIMDVHKIVLIYSAKYFEEICSSNPLLREIELSVPNVHVTYDIISSFYKIKPQSNNIPIWRYQLLTFKCRSLLLLLNDVRQLYDIKVPSEDFELLVDVVSQFDVTNDIKLVRCIRKNLPINFNINRLGNDLKIELKKKTLYMASGLANGNVDIHNVNTGELYCELWGNRSPIRCMSFSSDVKKFIAGKQDGYIEIWDITKTNIIQTTKSIRGHSNCINDIVVTSDNSKIISCSNDGTIKIWNNGGDLLRTFIHGYEHVFCIALSSDNKTLVSGGNDIKIWDLCNGGALIRTINRTSNGFVPKYVSSIALSKDGQKIFSVLDSFYVIVWNAITGEMINSIDNLFYYRIDDMILSSDDKNMIMAESHYISIRDSTTGKHINRSFEYSDDNRGIAVSDDDSVIVSGHYKFTRIHNAKTGRLIDTICCTDPSICCVALSPSI